MKSALRLATASTLAAMCICAHAADAKHPALVGGTRLAVAPDESPIAEFPSRLTCAVATVQACTALGCTSETPTSLDLPSNFEFDTPSGTIAGVRPDGTRVRTPAVLRSRAGALVILQGTEGPFAWSVTFNPAITRMTMVIATEGFSVTLSGRCAPSE